jgi:hypothetical protein
MPDSQPIAARLDSEFVEIMIRELLGQSNQAKPSELSDAQEEPAECESEPLPQEVTVEVVGDASELAKTSTSEDASEVAVSGDRQKGSSRFGQKERVPRGRIKMVLQIAEPGQPERVVRLTRKPIVLGRGRESDIVLKDAGVSRQHVRLELQEDSVLVEDLQSRNGTMINDHFIREKEEAFLNDVVRVGKTVIHFREVE